MGLADGTNPYVYVGNRPLNYIDPKGNISVVTAWVGMCSGYSFVQTMNKNFNSDVINSDLPIGENGYQDDKKRHCYASCLLTKCMLGLPIAPAVGVAKEVMDYYKTDGEFSIDDIRANNVGVKYAYQFKSCNACSGNSCK